MTVPQDNRARILDTAEMLFAEKGYAATSVREILRGAGVSSPTLYHYFGSKEELLITLLRERFEEFFTRAREALAACPTPESALNAYALLAFEGLDGESTAVRFVFSVLYGPRAELPEHELRTLRANYGGTLVRALLRVAPDVPSRKVAFVAALFNGMLNGVLMQYLNGYLDQADGTLAAAIAGRAAAMLRDDLPIPDLSISVLPETEEGRP